MAPNDKSPRYRPINNMLPSEQAQILPELPDHLIDMVQDELRRAQIGIEAIVEVDDDIPPLILMEPPQTANSSIHVTNPIDRIIDLGLNQSDDELEAFPGDEQNLQEQQRRQEEQRLEEERKIKEIEQQKKKISMTEMVNTAIKKLYRRGSKKGVSYFKIKKFIKDNYKDDNRLKNLRRYILRAVAKGTLIRLTGKGVAGSFRFPEHIVNKSKLIKKPHGHQKVQKVVPKSKQKLRLRAFTRTTIAKNYAKNKPKGNANPKGRSTVKKTKQRTIGRRHTERKRKRVHRSIAKRVVSRLLIKVASGVLRQHAHRTLNRAISRAILQE